MSVITECFKNQRETPRQQMTEQGMRLLEESNHALNSFSYERMYIIRDEILTHVNELITMTGIHRAAWEAKRLAPAYDEIDRVIETKDRIMGAMPA